MKKVLRVLSVVLAFILLTACAPQPGPVDESEGKKWVENHNINLPKANLTESTKQNIEAGKALLEKILENPPIDFLYNGIAFSENQGAWNKTVSDEKNGKQLLLTNADGVQVELTIRFYEDSPAVEWTIHVTNTGSADSQQIQNFSSLSFAVNSKSNAKVFYSKGGNATDTDFQPITKKLENGESASLASVGGRSSSGFMPYFNVTTGTSNGYIVAIGWTGQWKASVSRKDNVTKMVAAMEETNFYLTPGESVMLPSVILMPWEGESQNAQNDFRRHILYHHTPQTKQNMISQSPLSVGIWGSSGTDGATSQVKGITKRELNYDVLWIDAGWYGDGTQVSENTFDSVWYNTVGTWTSIDALYPNGMKEVSDFAHENGVAFLLWFEPERVAKGSAISNEHDEWMLKLSGSNDYLFNLGNTEACEWLTEYIASLIKEYGVDIYREDFNFEPLQYWRKADDKNRTGITEMKYVEGLYHFWEALVEKCPGLMIDNCASGGRRLDFEAVSRCSVLSRSDYQCYTSTSSAEGCQMQIYGINYWLPVTGTISMGRTDSYNWRSNYSFGIQTPNVLNAWKLQKELNEEYLSIRKLMCGDYYPMIECTPNQDGWFAYQMDRSDLGKGFVCAFRRLKEETDTVTLVFGGLDEKASYELVVSDGGETVILSGADLMSKGYRLTIANKMDSRLITYTKVKNK